MLTGAEHTTVTLKFDSGTSVQLKRQRVLSTGMSEHVSGVGLVLEESQKWDDTSRKVQKQIRVVTTIPGSPAHKSGKLAQGDILKMVNKQDVAGLSVQDISERIVGDPDTAVVLTVSTGKSRTTFDVSLVRNGIALKMEDPAIIKEKQKVQRSAGGTCFLLCLFVDAIM
jgi:C-terminal processing protease CtpA/Prc